MNEKINSEEWGSNVGKKNNSQRFSDIRGSEEKLKKRTQLAVLVRAQSA